MKKGILALVVIVLSYAILSVGMNLVGTTGETFAGTAQGFGGEVSVSVLKDGDKIISVTATGANETDGVGSKAIDQLPAKIVEANSTDVDVIAGASVTSKAIIAAVNSALGIETAAEEPAEEAVAEIPDGALTGTAKGFGGDVTVYVVMDGDKITEVIAKGPDETQGIGSNAIDQLPAKIVEANSADVDVVAGATYSSKAIIEAVKAALASNTGSQEPAAEAPEGALTGKAEGFGGDVTVTVVMDGDKIVSVEAKGPNETDGIGSKAIEQLPAKIVEANSADVDIVAGATYSSKAVIEAVKAAIASNTNSEQSAAGGALTAKAEGFGGDVTVTVVMDGDKIVSVEAKGPNETDGIGSEAIEQLPAKIVEANSTEVDVIAGATYTSKAIIEAVNSAIN